ncbi:adenosylcobinamide-phosphate synthase CbiB [Youxingia wuxianensis]|uniref:Cobalamin biosynthesis protein CobD n=1 Tax=Youxingia wuxianensis TaxID=2763678 RepID=A0A926EM23_9FIRM|nr:adenosylcobinamide-phosphate synthase CbiB [Youxingia wuxianensis]MBC8585086.1 cobalamin biosynthesis protein CobD [Youxingia wuxianensis]
MFYSISVIALGFFLDLILGDPLWLPHPVRLIGKLISWLEKPLRAVFPKSKKGAYTAGVVLTLLVVTLSTAAPAGILWLASQINRQLVFLLEVIMCYQVLAMKSLRSESMKVYERLAQNDLDGARKAVSMIVGRDTENLTAQQVAKAAVETVAENTSDGVIAPLLFIVIGGAPLGFCYKAVNTLDSMIGYKNDRYLYFGRFAARLDDVVNFLPARLSAVFMIAASALVGLDFKNAAFIWKRDRFCHKSPNSAQTESACAGALHIQLAGDAFYFGELYEKPTIGDDLRPIELEDIPRANRLMYMTGFLCLAVFLLTKLAVLFVLH